MTDYDNTNRGVLFKNDRWTEGSKIPNYSGTINVDGHEYEISAWIKEGKKGKFMSLSFKEPYQKSGGGANTGYSGLDDGDSIPFSPEWR